MVGCQKLKDVSFTRLQYASPTFVPETLLKIKLIVSEKNFSRKHRVRWRDACSADWQVCATQPETSNG